MDIRSNTSSSAQKTGIQPVETTDSSLEQRFRFDSGGVLDSKVVHIFHDAVALEH
jgi:hypothetical protein